MSPDLPKQYNPSEQENKWYPWWEKQGLFVAGPEMNRKKDPYSIVIPPPNITGRLHMGHALNNSLQDVLTRWSRMRGKDTLWMPGTDHAGIATQNRVEKELNEQGLDRREMGREAFLEKVWEWRDEYGNLIIQQLQKMGCSCDWSRTRFTLDAGLSRAVRTVFKRLYDEGLIYKGSYLVNWCPKDQTALSDDEVEYKEVQGNLWYIRYPLEMGVQTADGKDYIVVATTRPETMLGDAAVAFNPEDSRYQHLKGTCCVLPLQNRRIPFIADEHVDSSFGTGLVKVTPAHDPNDYAMGKRHDLEMINILHPDGRLNENGGAYSGQDRKEARRNVVADLEDVGLLEKVEPHVHQVGHSYRSHAVVEPYISEQWFVSMKPLVKEAIAAVEDGRVRFVPKNWENTYFHWMRNVRDWCISRQLWWGHQIPVWYCDDCGHVTVSDAEDVTACEECGSVRVHQDPDVLDTWFSSALWPFSTMGWPDKTPDLSAYYPTSALLTAHEIIFFWVARMIIMGLKFMGDVPFRDVYIHPMVFDEKTKKKMSKSLGNIIDPLEMIEKYGADAMRMTVCAYAVKGSNLYLSEERFEGYRNFMNKFWNSARFVLMNVEDLDGALLDEPMDLASLEIEDRWIVHALGETIRRCDASLAAYEFDQYVHHLYHFTWGEYCDWYVELVKNRLYDKREDARTRESRRVAQIILVRALEGLCRLMAPVAPFITEEVWQSLPKASDQPESLMTAAWPDAEDFPALPGDVKANMDLLMGSISAIRKVRSEMGVQPGQAVDAAFSCDDAEALDFLKAHQVHIEALARVEKPVFLSAGDAAPEGPVSTAVAGPVTISVRLPAELMDAERERLDKEKEKLEKGVMGARKKLENPKFVEKAPEKVVQGERDRLAQMEQQLGVLREKLSALQ